MFLHIHFILNTFVSHLRAKATQDSLHKNKQIHCPTLVKQLLKIAI